MTTMSWRPRCRNSAGLCWWSRLTSLTTVACSCVRTRKARRSRQPINHIGAGLVNTPGALSWNELWTADLPSSKAFYGALLGWAFEAGPGVPVYTTIWNQGRRNGGILSMDEDMAAETPPMWVPHVSVADIEAAARRVVQLGGTVHVGPRTNADANRWLLFADPQGALCYLMQLNNPEPWLEHSS